MNHSNAPRWAAPLCALALCVPALPRAQAAPEPPLLDQMTAPFTDGEAAGIGCLVASAAVGAALTYLIGPEVVIASLAGPVPPARVLEGAAAAAFVFSSACYVGVALAPLGMLGYTSVSDDLAGPPQPALANPLALPEGAPSAAAGGAAVPASAPVPATRAAH